jgi:Mg2+/Co2+ transporter CorB
VLEMSVALEGFCSTFSSRGCSTGFAVHAVARMLYFIVREASANFNNARILRCFVRLAQRCGLAVSTEFEFLMGLVTLADVLEA